MKVHNYAIFFTVAYLVSLTMCDSSPSSNAASSASLNSPDDGQRVGRSPKYDFGLGKRRYIITTGGPGKKRLPHYNFGLGKRSNPYAYSFGLGKRADDVDEQYDENTDYYPDSSNVLNLNMENWENGGNNENKNDIDVIDYDLLRTNYEHKRSPRPYSFGLGKRRAYDFGLGKRKFSDELDKRLPNRYNFGLGRR
ncbi:unnamed protein product [Diamesa serratosioi]